MEEYLGSDDFSWGIAIGEGCKKNKGDIVEFAS